MLEIEQMANLKEKSAFGDLIFSSTSFTPLHWKPGFVAVAEIAH